MANANVSISFEAANQADAEKKIAGWTLHEGCQVYVSVTETPKPMRTTGKGKVEEAPPPEPPPPPTNGA